MMGQLQDLTLFYVWQTNEDYTYICSYVFEHPCLRAMSGFLFSQKKYGKDKTDFSYVGNVYELANFTLILKKAPLASRYSC